MMDRDRQEIETAAVHAIVARFGRHREIDDLIVIAREAVDAEIRAGRAITAADLTRFAIRRAICDCIDHIRMLARQDPTRRPLVQTSRREPMLHVTIRVPAATLSCILQRHPARSTSEALRLALEAAARE